MILLLLSNQYLMKNMKFNQIITKMEKYIIIKEGLGVKSIVCEVSYKENAVKLAENLNERCKADGSAMRFKAFELIES